MPNTSIRDKERALAWQRANKERVKEVNQRWRRNNRDRYFAMVAQHFKKHRRATPKWADKKAMIDIYEKMYRLNRESGARTFHIDHIIPLHGETICGLHCEDNLRLVMGKENMTKGRKLDAALIENTAGRCCIGTPAQEAGAP